jgi:hypothetical protein
VLYSFRAAFPARHFLQRSARALPAIRQSRYGRTERFARVTVDRQAREANAVCAGLVPEVFESVGDNLHILIADVPARPADAVRHAVRCWPKAALRLAAD